MVVASLASRVTAASNPQRRCSACPQLTTCTSTWNALWCWITGRSRRPASTSTSITASSPVRTKPGPPRMRLLGAVVDRNQDQLEASAVCRLKGYVVTATSLVRVFTGKASPSEVKDALWLAHRYGFITNPNRKRSGSRTLKAYTDAFCGLSCNGFVGNFEGIDPGTSVDRYAAQSQRLSSVDDLGGRHHPCLACAEPCQTLGSYRRNRRGDFARGDPMTFTVVQSGGAGSRSPLRGLDQERPRKS